MNYADGKIGIGTRTELTENGFTPEYEDEILEAVAGESFGPFDNVQDMIDFLNDNS